MRWRASWLSLVVIVALASGCATTQYDWNDYDRRLLDHYKAAGKDAEFLSVMSAHLLELESKGVRPPPGLYAEVGTFHLRRGDRGSAMAFYEKEKAAWPESRTLMTALIKSLEEKAKGEQQ